MKNNEIIDKALEDILKEIAPKVEEELGKQIDFDEYPEVEFPKEHTEKMNSIFKKYDRKQNRKRLFSYSKRVAIFLLALLIITSVGILSVDAWRTNIINFFMEINPTHTKFSFTKEINSNPYKVGHITRKKLTIFNVYSVYFAPFLQKKGEE